MNSLLCSTLYLSCLRETLATIFPEDKNKILNDLSEYQILYLTKYGKIPKEKNNYLKEKFLIESLKCYFIKNSDFLNEAIGEENTISITTNLCSITEWNLSSSPSKLKLLSEANLIKPIYKYYLHEIENNQRNQPHQFTWKEDPETGDKLLVDLTVNKIIKRVPKETSQEDLEKFMKHAMVMAGTVNSIGGAVNMATSAVRGVTSVGKGIYNSTKEAVPTVIGAAKNIGKSAASIGSTIVSKVGAANLGYAALAGALLYGGVKLYKNYLTKAGRACNHLSGQERIKCERKFKINGLRAQISDLQTSMSACNKTSNPQKCKMVVQNKINKIKQQIVNIQSTI